MDGNFGSLVNAQGAMLADVIETIIVTPTFQSLSVLEAPQARRQLLGTSAEPGISRKSLEAGIQPVAVAAGLLNTELFYAVIGDFVNVSGSAAR